MRSRHRGGGGGKQYTRRAAAVQHAMDASSMKVSADRPTAAAAKISEDRLSGSIAGSTPTANGSALFNPVP